MHELTIPLVWAQAAVAGSNGAATTGAGTGTGATNPAALAYLAFRRWCSGLTLSSPQSVPSLDGFYALLAGLAVLLIVAVVMQGPLLALKQLVDLPGHVRLVQRATRRVCARDGWSPRPSRSPCWPGRVARHWGSSRRDPTEGKPT